MQLGWFILYQVSNWSKEEIFPKEIVLEVEATD